MIAFNKNDITKKELVSKNTFNFLFVGRVEERKGIFELIKIADYLTNAGINFRFHIVGGGVLLNKLRTDQFQGKINRNLNFIGQVGSLNELRSYYKNTDALILTTHDEGFPRVLYEAMIFGVPIYTTMVGGIPGRMKNYYNCIEIPLRDGKRAGEIIKVTISNIELLNKITANASKTVSDILTNEKSHSLLLKNELDENFK
jgi:glycosyltransferase involved in cell wall biosynthesis